MGGMEEVLRIDVVLDRMETVRGTEGEVTMILFCGNFSCDLGKGEVLPGGVDTQICRKGEDKKLSARYILQGVDKQGETFRLFVENNGVCRKKAPLITSPVIYTDRSELKWMEQEKLVGTVEGNGENKVVIKIYRGEQA